RIGRDEAYLDLLAEWQAAAAPGPYRGLLELDGRPDRLAVMGLAMLDDRRREHLADPSGQRDRLGQVDHGPFELVASVVGSGHQGRQRWELAAGPRGDRRTGREGKAHLVDVAVG